MRISKKIQLILIPIIFILFVLSPLFEMKLLFFLTLVVLIVNNISTIKRVETWVFLGILFALSFINTPFWQVLPDPKLKILNLLLLMFAGGLWSYFSASDVTMKKISLPVIPLVVLTSCILAVNSRPLVSDIAWRGDEFFHVTKNMQLMNYIWGVFNVHTPFNTALSVIYLGIVIVTAASFFMTRAKKIILIFLGGVTILFQALFLFYQDLPLGWSPDILTLSDMARWPFLQKWITLLFLFPNFSYDIRLYRIIPLLCTILIAWYLFSKFDKKFNNHIVSVLFSLSFITIPLIYYFSTIVYLEMPIVLLMTYCVFNIQDVLFADTRTFVHKPVWYALLLMGFLKETVFIVLILLLVSRFVVQMVTHKFTVKRIFSELIVGVLATFPLLIFLLFRNYFVYYRPYTPQLSVLLDPRNYWVIVQELFIQMGALFPLSVAGFIVLFLKKERSIFFVLLILFIGIIIFFMMDGPFYLGYSRWNLFVIPIVFYLAYQFLTPAPKQTLLLCLVALIAGNYFLNPIMPDGVRINYWGCPNIDGAEYYYPYEQAIRYLKSERNIKSVMLLGQYFPHWGIQFYQAKYNFYPRILIHQFNGQQPAGVLWFDGRRFNAADEKNYLSEFFRNCREPGSETAAVDAIIYHSVNNIDIDTNKVYCGKYKNNIRVRNSLNSLYILK